jgi:retron-type reverse transcriptase
MRPEVAEKRLVSLSGLSQQGKRVNGLHRLLACPRIWERAYEAIAPNKGALTPGSDPTNTLDGFSLERMERIIAEVMSGTYRFAPVRRVYIPKTNGKKRPLGVPNADDKLVQAAVKLVLEQIYEPIFSDSSHGFRASHSCHTALEQIWRMWNGVVWLVDVDIVGFFDNIDHGILLDLLRKKIDDDNFLKLIKGMLAAGYMEDWTWHATYSGTPQGGVISPLLANIYLHELDEVMAQRRTEFYKGSQRRPDPEYLRIERAIDTRRRRVTALRNAGREDDAQAKLVEIRELHEARLMLESKDQFDPNYRRLLYVRYADDFLIGIIGSKQEARDILAWVTAYLGTALKLEVSNEKSKVAKASEGVTFLGYTVRTHDSKSMRRVVANGRTVTKRAPARKIQLHLPEEKLASFVERQKLGNYHIVRGEPRLELIHSSDIEIITMYSAVMRGIAEYYKLGTLWKQQLGRVYYIWWYSLVKTLAAKHKSSVASIFRTLLKVHNGDYGLWNDGVKGKRFVEVFKLKHVKEGQLSYEPKVDLEAQTYLSFNRTDMLDRLRARTCESCGSTEGPFEIHHARRLSDTTHLKLATMVRVARQRKRVAMCLPCHVALHAGRLQQRLDQPGANVGAG